MMAPGMMAPGMMAPGMMAWVSNRFGEKANILNKSLYQSAFSTSRNKYT